MDYNSDYINVCNKISERLNLNCKFESNLFKNITGEYDVVQMLGIIHHIFIRTEQNNSFKTIFKKINSITKRYLIIEFPTENDPKAKKWTNIPSRNKIHYYNQENFLHEAKKYFSDIKLIDNTTIHRPIYLMVK